MWPFASSYQFRSVDKIATPLNHSSNSSPKGIIEYDYVIIGGGTSGCVLASRLSEDPNVSILLLERGGVSSWMSRVPLLAFANLFRENTKIDYIYNWFASIAPVDGAGVDTGPIMNPNVSQKADVDAATGAGVARVFSTIWSPGKIALLAGKVLGGSSNLNAQIYTRPYPGELDTWGRRGTEGPWLTKKMHKTYFGSDTQTRKAANAIGVPTIHESNLPEGPAVGVFELERTSDSKGYKLSTFDAFLPRPLSRCNVHRYWRETGDELQAKGVFLSSEQTNAGNNSKKPYYVAAKREVILCAGVIVSPQILMLSGVGPKRHLEEIGIPVLKDLPGVGEHLKKPLVFILEFFKFLLFGIGYFLLPIPQSVIYLRSAVLNDEGELPKEIPSPELDTRSPNYIPDIEININPCITTFFPTPLTRNDKGYFSFFTFGLQPKSLGHVRLVSKDPFEKVDCMLGFHAREEDRRVMRKAIRFCVKLALKMKEQGYDIEPLLVSESNEDKNLDNFIRHEPRSNYHYSSTCRMAPEYPQNPSDPNDTPGVIDNELRVYGIHKLRVADASIFPTIPAGHLQAHTVLVAEKYAEMLKDSWKE